MKTGAARQSSVWSGKALNGWWLFWLVAAGTGAAVALRMPTMDLADPLGVSAMIQFSVRVAVPWLFLAFAASALAALTPGAFSRWLLRNRRILGLCFAAGMGWQLFFILWLVTLHWNYYLEEAYSYFDLAVQVPGYLVLIAMSATLVSVQAQQAQRKAVEGAAQGRHLLSVGGRLEHLLVRTLLLRGHPTHRLRLLLGRLRRLGGARGGLEQEAARVPRIGRRLTCVIVGGGLA